MPYLTHERFLLTGVGPMVRSGISDLLAFDTSGSVYSQNHMTASNLVAGIRFVVYKVTIKSRRHIPDYVRDCIIAISNSHACYGHVHAP